MTDPVTCFDGYAYNNAQARIISDGYEVNDGDNSRFVGRYWCDAANPGYLIESSTYTQSGKADDLWIGEDKRAHKMWRVRESEKGVRVVLGWIQEKIDVKDQLKYGALRMYYDCEVAGERDLSSCVASAQSELNAKKKDLVERADKIWTRAAEIVAAVRQEDEGAGGIDSKPAVDLYYEHLREKGDTQDAGAYYARAEKLLLELFANGSVRETVEKHAMELKCLTASEFHHKPYEKYCSSGYHSVDHRYVQVTCQDIEFNEEALVYPGGCSRDTPTPKESHGGWR